MPEELGWIERDANGQMTITDDGCITCICQGGTSFRVPYKDIDFTCDTIQTTIDNNTVIINLHEHTLSNNNNITEDEPNIEVQNENRSDEPYLWTEANTKLFLQLYKNAMTNEKVRTKKLLWRKLSETLQSQNYNVSAAQVENKLKSLERGYKNMISNNKKTGRNRISCSYETELTDLFAKKHNMIPLATSGNKGTTIREDAGSSSSVVCHTSEETSLSKGRLTTTDNMNMEADENPDTASIGNPDNECTAAIETENNPSTSNVTRNQMLNKTSRRKQLGKTGKSLELCQQELSTLIEEIRRDRQERYGTQRQMQETYCQYLRDLNTTMQERNDILRQLLQASINEKNKD